MRLLYRFYRWGNRLRGWFVRRFTVAGRFVLVALALSASLASDPEQTSGHLAFVVLLALLLVALGASPFFRIAMSLERRLPRFATLGEPLRYRIILRNPTRQLQRGLDYLEDLGGDGLSYEAFVERLRPGRRNRTLQLSAPLPPTQAAVVRACVAPAVPAGGSVETSAEIVPLRRGLLEFKGAWLGRRDPLGLFRSLHRITQPGTLVVLPRRYRLPAISLPGQARYHHGGVAFASGVGESEEFAALREYRRGDSLRRVHWRASARLGRPVVREYQDEFFVRHALVLDTFGDASTDTLFEEAVSLAASFACTVPDQDSLLDLLFVGPKAVCVTTGRSVGHAEQMLETLACARPCRDQRFADLQELVLRHCERVSGCILVLLEWDDRRRQLVGALRARGVPVWALVIVAPGETLSKAECGVRSAEFNARRGASVASRGGKAPTALEQPDRLVVLEVGRIEDGLRML
jgi:uncharacterized protein (DUF58 family)